MTSQTNRSKITNSPPVKFVVNSLALFLRDFKIYSRYYMKYRRYRALPALKKGFEDHRNNSGQESPTPPEVFKRLADAYNRAKETQKTVSVPYQVGVQWQRDLDRKGKELIETLRAGNTDRLRELLENFTREDCGFSINLATDYIMMKRRPSSFKYEYINTWYHFYNLYQQIMFRPPELRYPCVGNPVGLSHNGAVIPYETIRFNYYAGEILGLVSGTKHPVICEIGGGTGGQAYQVLISRERPVTYILFDIPEVLVISSYFLMASLPDKKILLYGEGEPTGENLKRYDLVLMPNFMLPALGNKTVDLFFNQASFSEMDSRTLQEYLGQIERICKRYLLHANHNRKFTFNEDGAQSSNLPSGEAVLSPEIFRKIYQHPFPFISEYQENNYRGTESYASFLYERIQPKR